MATPQENVPLNYGLLLFPQFEVLDAAGPIETLNVVNFYYEKGINLSVIAETTDPVDPGSIDSKALTRSFNGQQKYLPTHTFENAPHLDVLIIPGGRGTVRPDSELEPMLNFIRDSYFGRGGRQPLKYIFSICTGASLLAKAGVLDGHRATANKKAWARVTPHGPKTHWVARARWVESKNIWTTSGVSAGIDGMVALIAKIYDDKTAEEVCDIIEHTRQKDPDHDPFAELNGCEDVLPVE